MASREWLVLGLRALLIEDLTNDPRETVTKLALLRHSAGKILADFGSMARDAYSSAASEIPPTISRYLSNPV
jgi:hypothetical protein